MDGWVEYLLIVFGLKLHFHDEKHFLCSIPWQFNYQAVILVEGGFVEKHWKKTKTRIRTGDYKIPKFVDDVTRKYKRG